MSRRVVIITSAHWDGDPRLGRHMNYLESAGHHLSLMSFSGGSRVAGILKSLRAVAATRADVVILPDPELFLLGSLVARLFGRRPVIDIHEDYPRAAMARTWAPAPLRPLIGALARASVALGRRVAWRVVVAAPQLARGGDAVVLNIPDPPSLQFHPDTGSHTLVYVGDVTIARGAVEMVRTLAALNESFELLVIGRVDQAARRAMDQESMITGVRDRLRLLGRMPHADAWAEAGVALVGLSLLHPVPAYREAVATKIWEYMAVGLPPVVSDLPGQREIVSRLDPDLVCDSPESAAEIVRTLASDTDRYRELAARGRLLVETAWAESRPDRELQSVLAP